MRNQVLSSFKKPSHFSPFFFIKRRQSLSVIYTSFSFFFFFFFRQVVNCCTWTRRPWLFNIHTLLSYMFNGEITRIQTHDAVIFATKGNSTGDARLFLQQSWPRKTTKTCSTFVTCRKPTWLSLSLHLCVCLFFPFLFYCFSLDWCSEYRHFQRTRTATMRSAAAHVSARQSTSNQLAIIDINKVISIVNVQQNKNQGMCL